MTRDETSHQGQSGQEQAGWQAALADADEDTFQQLVRPHMDRLLAAARSDLDYYIDQGHLRENDFTPEEVTGEALVAAWAHRDERPASMSLEGWLLTTQYWALRHLVEEQEQYRQTKALSLDAPIPPDARPSQERRQYMYGLQEGPGRISWEDVVPGQTPVDIEAPLFTNQDTFELNPEARHVVMMHDEFEMDLPEVAFAMNRSVRETAELLDRARTTLHERQVEGPPPDDYPNPPEEEAAGT